MRFAIIGGGPVGLILAAHLAQADQTVYVSDIWQEHLQATLRDGIEIAGVRDMHARIAGGFDNILGLKEVNPDYLVLSVKACILRKIMPEVTEVVGPNTVIVSLQNGLDTEEVIAHTFNRHQILRVVVNYAGNIVAPGKVAMNFFNKPNHLGCNCKGVECSHAAPLLELLNGVFLDTRYEPDIKRYVWEKTILNAALSPVSAVTGMTMREVMEMSETYRVVESLLNESIKVAALSGYDFGPGFFTFCMSYLEKGGPHKPSMLVDIENRRETEIDFINGRIVYYGSLFNIPTPVNDMFTRLVKAMQVRYLHSGTAGA